MSVRRVPRRFRRGLLATVASLALVAGASAAAAANQAVSIAGFAFSPASVTVTVGDTVTWTNSDSTNHTATASGGSFDTGTIANGTSKSVTFNTAGTFPYHCSIHTNMTGTVIVQAASGGGGASTPPPTDSMIASAGDGGLGALAILMLAGMGGYAVARRRFAGSK